MVELTNGLFIHKKNHNPLSEAVALYSNAVQILSRFNEKNLIIFEYFSDVAIVV